MPVRKVSNRGGNIIGYFPSLKMGKMVTFESTIERDLLYLLDYEAHVVAFADQPLVITYLDNGRKHTYTPDFHVKFADGNDTIIECKPHDLTGTAENRRKFAAGSTWAAEKGWAFAVITEKALRTSHRLGNVKLLTRHARHEIPDSLKLRIQHYLAHGASPKSIADLVVEMAPENVGAIITAVYQMLFYHELVTEMDDVPITPQSLVHLPAGKDESP
ncbi:MAG: TnsA endonuclease N-terminal domain-containing protein [Anaerolineales bacterium]|nr:TnsA endonuclease N-terminal domain-containing protein [Anaerolineales bacterium]